MQEVDGEGTAEAARQTRRFRPAAFLPRSVKLALLRAFSFLPGGLGKHAFERRRAKVWRDTAAEFEASLAGCVGRIAVDLGANYGTYTARMASVASRVYAFEPDPDTRARLAERCGTLSNVEIVPAAAGGRAGEVALYRFPAPHLDAEARSHSSNILGDHGGRCVDSGVRVPVLDFVEWLEGLDGDLGLLKIDIEGAETDLLERLVESGQVLRFRAIFVETHERHYPDHGPRLRRIWRQTRPLALRLRFRHYGRVPTVNLDWH